MPRIVSDEFFFSVQALMDHHPRQNAFALASRLLDAATGTPYRGTSGTGCSGRRSSTTQCRSATATRGRYPKNEVEAAAMAVPTVEEMAAWVRTRLCRRDPEALLRHAASRATIDDRGVPRVEIPWRESESLLEKGVTAAQKIGERPAQGQFAEFQFGSPYQIRTGDLRLERAAS